jgi:hypothetical protein
MTSKSRRLKLGVLANEVFSTEIGRMGGFGWAGREDPNLARLSEKMFTTC